MDFPGGSDVELFPIIQVSEMHLLLRRQETLACVVLLNSVIALGAVSRLQSTLSQSLMGS